MVSYEKTLWNYVARKGCVPIKKFTKNFINFNEYFNDISFFTDSFRGILGT